MDPQVRGGQSVNMRSTVPVTHVPTGMVITFQVSIKIKAKALRILACVYWKWKESQKEENSNRKRRVQIGSGERSEESALITQNQLQYRIN